jgi:hypothetical protein
VPLERQKEVFASVRGLIQREFPIADKGGAHRYFTRLTGLLKNPNYTARNAPEYSEYLAQIDKLVSTLGRASVKKSDARVALASADMRAARAPARRQHRRRRRRENQRVTALNHTPTIARLSDDPEGHDPSLQGHDRQGHQRDAMAARRVCRSSAALQ